MRINLVRLTNIQNRMFPLGLACLQAYLKANDICVKVFDIKSTKYQLDSILSQNFSQPVPMSVIPSFHELPQLFYFTDEFMSSKSMVPDFNSEIYNFLFQDYAINLFESVDMVSRSYRKKFSFVKKAVRSFIDAELIGFQLTIFNTIETVMASALIKKIDPEKKIVWGGPSLTNAYKEYSFFLDKKICDAFVIGEGEEPLKQMAKGKKFHEIPGVFSYDERINDYFITPQSELDLNTLPTPDYTDLSFPPFHNIAIIYSSRGCTNRCEFCAEWNLLGPHYRRRNPELVAEDIIKIQKKTGVKRFLFADSLINPDISHISKLCSAIINRKIKAKFIAQFRSDNINSDVASLLNKAGFTDLIIGTEAFTEQLLEKMNKKNSVDNNLKIIEIAVKHKFFLILQIILGFGDVNTEIENYNSILKLMDEINKRFKYKNGRSMFAGLFQPSFFVCLPNSSIYKKEFAQLERWKPLKQINFENSEIINKISDYMADIPYKFKRKIDNMTLMSLILSFNHHKKKRRFPLTNISRYLFIKQILFMLMQKNKFLFKIYLKFKKYSHPGEFY